MTQKYDWLILSAYRADFLVIASTVDDDWSRFLPGTPLFSDVLRLI